MKNHDAETESVRSELSEISVNTDMRVFNGAISLLNKPKNLKQNPKTNEAINKTVEKENLQPLSFRETYFDEDNLNEKIKHSSNNVIEVERVNFKNDEEYDLDENNIFWNLKDNGETDLNVKHKLNDKSNFKLNPNTSNTTNISCIVSSIEKGIAVLVTNDDTIFKLPAFFLPKNIVPGNSYNIIIEESVKAHSRVLNIQKLQRKLKSNKFDLKKK